MQGTKSKVQRMYHVHAYGTAGDDVNQGHVSSPFAQIELAALRAVVRLPPLHAL